jgi:cytochrome oxidase Cu insertion factor (SCO1/SenC/PrrC family)
VIVVGVGAVLVGCSSVSVNPGTQRAMTGNPPAAKTGTSVGNTAPDFRLTKMDGSQVSLADLHGTVQLC